MGNRVIPVVLSGGSGSRLWPKSRQHYPKQLHRLYGDKTMLQHTLHRVRHLDASPIVICSNDQRFMVAEQVRDLDIAADIILEPVARNTAPAIVIAALFALRRAEDAIVAVFPADHLIKDQAAFEAALQQAIQAAGNDRLITFGVQPTQPETGYGYIKVEQSDNSDSSAKQIAAFVEKPDLETAQTYLASGDYYWNSGMFVFCARTLLQECETYCPETVKHCRLALERADKDLDFLRLEEQSFGLCESESIDYALMEKTQRAQMVPLSAQWSDVGSWEALWEVSSKDDHNNVIQGDVISYNSHNCLASSEGRLIALIGVENLVVIETADSVMVLNKSCSQDVKKVVSTLEANQRSEYEAHREVFRPWGSYDLISVGDRYNVKKITVKPGASLSLQLHHHRAEHWVVVKGTAQVQQDDQILTLAENQSVYIPLGHKHRLTNPGLIPLVLIEVASGSYLGEDDIVRISDGYGRA